MQRQKTMNINVFQWWRVFFSMCHYISLPAKRKETREKNIRFLQAYRAPSRDGPLANSSGITHKCSIQQQFWRRSYLSRICSLIKEYEGNECNALQFKHGVSQLGESEFARNVVGLKNKKKCGHSDRLARGMQHSTRRLHKRSWTVKSGYGKQLTSSQIWQRKTLWLSFAMDCKQTVRLNTY